MQPTAQAVGMLQQRCTSPGGAKTVTIQTEVLRPLDLLNRLGIKDPDPVVVNDGRFYHLHELD
jgi:hypothetical protein